MNMQDENRKFGIQTAQRRTDNTAVIGVNLPTTLGVGEGVVANRPWISEVKLERRGRLT
jgi:hypothetical protein